MLTLAYFAEPAPPRPAVLEVENPAEPAEWMWLQRANADGTIPPTAYQEALAQTRKIEASTRSGSPQLSDVQWRLLGPSNIGGRLIDLVLHPTTPGMVYVACTGGVWKSTDGGATPTSAWSDDLPQSMGALAIAPDGTLYRKYRRAGPWRWWLVLRNRHLPLDGRWRDPWTSLSG